MTAGVLAPLARGRSLRTRAATCARRSPAAVVLVPGRGRKKHGTGGELNAAAEAREPAEAEDFELGRAGVVAEELGGQAVGAVGNG